MGRFKKGESGNPEGRPRGSTNKNLQLLREAAEEILPGVIEKAKNGDAEAQRLILDRGIPRLRPVTMPEPLVLPGGNFAEQLKSLMALIATGDLSPSTAAEIASVISAAARVEEIDQLRDELAALRAVLEGRK
jgi:Family of unknown function (DUF5681)